MKNTVYTISALRKDNNKPITFTKSDKKGTNWLVSNLEKTQLFNKIFIKSERRMN